MLALSGELNTDMRGGARSSGKKVRGKFKKRAEPRRFFMTPRDLHEANSPLLRWQCSIPRICILLLPELDAAGEELAALCAGEHLLGNHLTAGVHAVLTSPNKHRK